MAFENRLSAAAAESPAAIASWMNSLRFMPARFMFLIQSKL